MVAIATLLMLATAGCRDHEAAPTHPDLDDPGPLEGFGPCLTPRRGSVEPVRGLDLPPGAILTSDRATGRLTIVHGFIEMTPIAIRQFYEQRTDLEFFLIEDEITEAEVFFTDGSYRNYVKARAECDRGSNLFVIVAPEKYAGEVSIPKRKPPPSP